MLTRQYAAISVAYWRLTFKKLGVNHIFFHFFISIDYFVELHRFQKSHRFFCIWI